MVWICQESHNWDSKFNNPVVGLFLSWSLRMAWKLCYKYMSVLRRKIGRPYIHILSLIIMKNILLHLSLCPLQGVIILLQVTNQTQENPSHHLRTHVFNSCIRKVCELSHCLKPNFLYNQCISIQWVIFSMNLLHWTKPPSICFSANQSRNLASYWLESSTHFKQMLVGR